MGDDERIGYALVGYPAAGKSLAARLLAAGTAGIMIETGDIVRAGAEEHFGTLADDLSSTELGDYSTMRRETDGGDYVAQDVIATLEARDDFPARPAVISGMRDSEVPDLFGAWFDEFAILWIHAPFEVRLQRIQARDRQDESEFTKADLAERDGRESMWGTSDLTFIADHQIENAGTRDDLRHAITEVVDRV